MESTQLKSMDLSFLDYTQRQLSEISPEGLHRGLSQLEVSGHFHFSNQTWTSNSYEGFAIISMVTDNPGNQSLMDQIIQIRNQIESAFIKEGSFYSLPVSSYHQTLANTLSAEKFQTRIGIPGKEKDYTEIIRNSFHKIRSYHENEPIRMSMVGLSLFKNAIGLLGIFKKEEDYKRILNFREKFYGFQPLQEYGVQMTRPFIGHITLGYFEKQLLEVEKENLNQVLLKINQELFKSPPFFFISQTSLRRYHSLSEFYREDFFPVHQF